MKEGDIMKWFRPEDLKDVNILRTAYKKLLIKYHPDNNAKDTTGIMQEINAEYDLLFQKLKDTYEHSESYEKQTDRQKQAYDWEKDKQLRAVIVALSKFAGLEIELCGTWVYVRGETYPYRKELKDLGLRFNSHKRCWIIHFDDYYKYHKKPVGMSYIRSKYGSVIIQTDTREERRLEKCP